MRRYKLICLFLLIGIGLLFLPLEKVRNVSFYITSNGLDSVCDDKATYFSLIDFNLFEMFNWTCYYAVFFPVLIIWYTFLPKYFQTWMFFVFILVNIIIAVCGLFFIQFALDFANMFNEITRLIGIILLDSILIIYMIFSLTLFHKGLRERFLAIF